MRIALLLALFVVCTLAQAADPLPVHLSGKIEIDTEGRVSSAQLDAEAVKDAVIEQIEAGLKRWRFEPIIENGRAVPARTTINLRLDPQPHAQGWQWTVRAVTFGEPKSLNMQPPRYPREMVYARLGADVRLLVTLDAEGQVIEALPYSARLVGSKRKDKERNQALAYFIAQSQDAVKQWRYDPATVSNDPEQRSFLVPLSYWLEDSPTTKQPWVRFAESAAPLADSADALAEALDSDAPVALNSPFRLIEGGAGSAL